MSRIILASASPRRVELLKQVGVQFEVIPSNVEEIIEPGLSPEDLAQSLSYQKAASVSDKVQGEALVIGADTIVVKEGILGKPKDQEEALHMLRSLQGEWHEVITGVSLIHPMTKKSIQSYEKTYVKMRALPDDVLKAYIGTKEPMDKAGAYGIQGMGALLVEKIKGCYFNVVGLPLVKTAVLLEEFGVQVL